MTNTRETNMKEAMPEELDESLYRTRVFQLVRQIPAGHVMTYGQVAELLGEGYTARTVGFVMHSAMEDAGIPWHRVINAQGGCSTARFMLPPDKQQRMLEAEGVEFNERGRCKLDSYLWSPDGDNSGGKKSDDAAQRPTNPTLF